jgi:hypothetical protein
LIDVDIGRSTDVPTVDLRIRRQKVFGQRDDLVNQRDGDVDQDPIIDVDVVGLDEDNPIRPVDQLFYIQIDPVLKGIPDQPVFPDGDTEETTPTRLPR